MTEQTIYVHPTLGQDQQEGSETRPLRTISAAIARHPPHAEGVIYLATGFYGTAIGERFPLVIPAGCRVVGTGGRDRPATVIQGSGLWTDKTLGAIAATCVIENDGALTTVMLINGQADGIGLWLASGRSHVERVYVTRCARYGIGIAAEAIPTVAECWVVDNAGVGIAGLQRGKGVLSAVIGRDNGTAIALTDDAAPLVLNCDLTHNEVGMVVSQRSRPILRQTRLTHNRADGLRLQDRAEPDLGEPQDPGGNVIRHNGGRDIRNETGRSLNTCGNDLIPQQLQGPVALLVSQVPDPAAVPARRIDTDGAAAAGPETPFPEPMPEPEPIPVGSQRFRDMGQHWAGAFVDGLARDGLLTGFGDGTFRPDVAVTRAQFAAVVAASFRDRPVVRDAESFSDVAANFWGAQAISAAYRRGFLSGYPDGTLRPNQPITRIQALVALTNGLGFEPGRVDAIGIYRDRAQVPSYAVGALAAATQQRLVVNYPDALQVRPQEYATRAEVAALVYQGRVALGQAPMLSSPYIVRPDTTQPLFADLGSHWAVPFITALAQIHAVSGSPDGRFLPDQPMNRAQYAALITQAFHPTPQRPETAFRDVPPTFWGAAAIQTAYRGGFLSGFPDQTFGPDQALLRVQVWVSLIEGTPLGQTESVDLNILGRFADYTALPRYALRASAIATQANIIVPYPDRTKLRPNQVATRAEVCVAVYQTLVALDRLPAIALPEQRLG